MLVVAGCAGHQGGSVAAGGGSVTTGGASGGPVSAAPTEVTGPAMPGVHLPAGAVPVAGSQVDASSLPSGFPREVWLTNNGGVLGFYGEQGGCFTASASTTQQTDSEVVVRLVQQEPGTGERACPMYLAYKPMSVSLAKPLGTRTVVLQLSIVRG
jgi:hypothetical protein